MVSKPAKNSHHSSKMRHAAITPQLDDILSCFCEKLSAIYSALANGFNDYHSINCPNV